MTEQEKDKLREETRAAMEARDKARAEAAEAIKSGNAEAAKVAVEKFNQAEKRFTAAEAAFASALGMKRKKGKSAPQWVQSAQTPSPPPSTGASGAGTGSAGPAGWPKGATFWGTTVPPGTPPTAIPVHPKKTSSKPPKVPGPATRPLTVNQIAAAVHSGTLTASQGQQYVRRLGASKSLSATQIQQAVLRGLISDADAQQYLMSLGYSQHDADVLIETSKRIEKPKEKGFVHKLENLGMAAGKFVPQIGEIARMSRALGDIMDAFKDLWGGGQKAQPVPPTASQPPQAQPPPPASPPASPPPQPPTAGPVQPPPAPPGGKPPPTAIPVTQPQQPPPPNAQSHPAFMKKAASVAGAVASAPVKGAKAIQGRMEKDFGKWGGRGITAAWAALPGVGWLVPPIAYAAKGIYKAFGGGKEKKDIPWHEREHVDITPVAQRMEEDQPLAQPPGEQRERQIPQIVPPPPNPAKEQIEKLTQQFMGQMGIPRETLGRVNLVERPELHQASPNPIPGRKIAAFYHRPQSTKEKPEIFLRETVAKQKESVLRVLSHELGHHLDRVHGGGEMASRQPGSEIQKMVEKYREVVAPQHQSGLDEASKEYVNRPPEIFAEMNRLQLTGKARFPELEALYKKGPPKAATPTKSSKESMPYIPSAWAEEREAALAQQLPETKTNLADGGHMSRFPGMDKTASDALTGKQSEGGQDMNLLKESIDKLIPKIDELIKAMDDSTEETENKGKKKSMWKAGESGGGGGGVGIPGRVGLRAARVAGRAVGGLGRLLGIMRPLIP